MNKKEEFENALKIATDGGFRSKTEAELWAIDYVRFSCDTPTMDGAIDAANILEAERLIRQTQREIDHSRCVNYRQNLFFDDPQKAEASCNINPGQLIQLEEKATQLYASTAVIEACRMKNANEFYTHAEAEQIARKELDLPKQKTTIASASVPDLFGKTPSEIAKIAADLEPSKKKGIPSNFGKTQKQIQSGC